MTTTSANPELKLKFGKHRGKTIEELPSGYLRWMVDKLEAGKFDNDRLVAAAESEIKYRDAHDGHWDDADAARDRDRRGPRR